MSDLSRIDIKFLSGVGPKRAEMLAKQLDIHSFRDLLYYFPFRYIDRSSIYKIANLQGDMPYIQLKGRFLGFTAHGEGARRRLHALFNDGSGTIEVVWFNRVKYIQENYHTGVEYILFGKPTMFNGRYNLTHPEIDVYKPEAEIKGLQGVYYITETLRNRSFTSRNIRQLVENLLSSVKLIDETLPDEIIRANHLMPLDAALRNIHRPECKRPGSGKPVRTPARSRKCPAY